MYNKFKYFMYYRTLQYVNAKATLYNTNEITQIRHPSKNNEKHILPLHVSFNCFPKNTAKVTHCLVNISINAPKIDNAPLIVFTQSF